MIVVAQFMGFLMQCKSLQFKVKRKTMVKYISYFIVLIITLLSLLFYFLFFIQPCYHYLTILVLFKYYCHVGN